MTHVSMSSASFDARRITSRLYEMGGQHWTVIRLGDRVELCFQGRDGVDNARALAARLWECAREMQYRLDDVGEVRPDAMGTPDMFTPAPQAGALPPFAAVVTSTGEVTGTDETPEEIARTHARAAAALLRPVGDVIRFPGGGSDDTRGDK